MGRKKRTELTRAEARKIVRDQVVRVESEEKGLTSAEKHQRALNLSVTAIDEAHTYPDDWGLAGKALELIDASVLRFFVGLLVDQFASDLP
ncbi:hypothetical protein LCGC14_0436790 [marine sediment metagenome]|uniref:Uncharacterized protein n=1 Tax=marine sediment metagenome TaxID=412755 RepID=A0A0F9SLH1_9ZZZZ